MTKKKRKKMWWQVKKKSKKKKKTYKRDWSLYNLAQENEVFVFLRYLPLAVFSVVGNKSLCKNTGRPPIELYTILICLAMQQYIGKALRRSMGWIKLLVKFAGIPIQIPCFKTLDNYLNNSAIKPYLGELIEITSSPLKIIEHFFATDSSGIRTNCFSSWYSIRTNKTIKKRDHITSHITTGTKLNPVTDVDVCVESGKDNEILREHIKQTAKNFLVEEWSGDTKYFARDNCNAVEAAGGKPFFRPRKDATCKADGSYAFMRMMLDYYNKPIKSKRSYNKRSNAESTIHAKKSKLGDFVRCKEDNAKENEEHIRWIDYNFTVLARALYELNIIPEFIK